MKKLFPVLVSAALGISAYSSANYKMLDDFGFISADKNVVQNLDNRLKREPKNEKLKAELGLELCKTSPDRIDEAVTRLSRAVDLFPSNTDYKTGLCRAYRLKGRKTADRALVYCRKSLELAPDDVWANRETGLTYFVKGDTANALKHLEAAVKKSPDDFVSLFVLGSIRFARGDYRKSLGSLKMAEIKVQAPASGAVERQTAEIFLAQGDAYAKLSERENAISAYRKCYEFDPKGELGELAKARAALLPDDDLKLKEPKTPSVKTKAAGKAEQAVLRGAPATRKLTAAQKAELDKCKTEAQEYFRQQMRDEAKNKYEECLAIQPADITAIISLGGIYKLAEDYPSAEKYFRQGLALSAQKSAMEAYASARLGEIVFKSGKIKEARDYFKTAVNYDPDDVNSIVGLAKCSEVESKWKDAVYGYNKALELEPTNEYARKGIWRVEPNIMDDEEILLELKERKIADAQKPALFGNDKQVFTEVRKAENLGAVDYVIEKAKININDISISPYLTERKPKNGPYRILLTGEGFKLYRKLLAQDAVTYFMDKGHNLQDVLAMGDLNGKPVFEEGSGLLTYEGLEVYYQSKLGRDKFKIAGAKTDAELIPPYVKQIEKLSADGFVEIDRAQYYWLAKVTNCPDNIMTNELGARIVKTPDATRFFIREKGEKYNLYAEIERYRQGDFSLTPQETETAGSAAKICDGYGKLKR